jgi:arginine exporter protein ArgO
MAYANAESVFGTGVPKVWRRPPRPLLFGNVVLVVFLLCQVFDGAFTYMGVMTFGTGIEANPLLAALMAHMGHGTALMTAKFAAASLGIGLHLRGTHAAVAVLAAFYVIAAVLPWALILFY